MKLTIVLSVQKGKRYIFFCDENHEKTRLATRPSWDRISELCRVKGKLVDFFLGSSYSYIEFEFLREGR